MVDREPVSARPLGDEPATTPWAEGRGRLGAADTYWLTTTRSDGRPHVVPVLAVLVDQALFFVAGPSTAKARNLASDPHCIIAANGPSLDVVVEGEAAKVHDDATLRQVADAYGSKYDWHVNVRDGAFHDTDGAPTAGPPPYDVYQVTPRTAFGFGTDQTLSSTRWRF